VKDLLRKFPVQPDAADFIAHLRPLQPRLYDVANYHGGNAGEVHLLFKQYRYWFGERIETGVASEYLANVPMGAELRIYAHHSLKFRLDGNSQAPLILLAEGTGIAPYRAFIEKIRAERSGRRCWIVFLEMQYEQDFLYQSEWQQAVGDGLVTWFDGVFVSDEPDRSLQQTVLHEGGRFIDLMQQGAHVYFCGDKKILTDCELALAAYYDAHVGKLPNRQEPDNWKAAGKAGRIHRNLY
jgi:sulfite reductase (NADPH) flavoprotein alpha-component